MVVFTCTAHQIFYQPFQFSTIVYSEASCIFTFLFTFTSEPFQELQFIPTCTIYSSEMSVKPYCWIVKQFWTENHGPGVQEHSAVGNRRALQCRVVQSAWLSALHLSRLQRHILLRTLSALRPFGMNVRMKIGICISLYFSVKLYRNQGEPSRCAQCALFQSLREMERTWIVQWNGLMPA